MKKVLEDKLDRLLIEVFTCIITAALTSKISLKYQ